MSIFSVFATTLFITAATAHGTTTSLPRRVHIQGQHFINTATNQPIVLSGPNVVVKGPPYLPAEGGDRFVPLCLIALEMLGDPEGQQQPDSVIAGGWMLLNFIATFNPENSQAFWDAGVLDIMQRTLDGREHRLFCMPFLG